MVMKAKALITGFLSWLLACPAVGQVGDNSMTSSKILFGCISTNYPYPKNRPNICTKISGKP
jgi:hypothetical protein